VLRQYAAQGAEEARQATDLTFSLENALKASRGEYEGLRDPQLFARKQDEERDLRTRVQANPDWSTAYGDSWKTIEIAEQTRRGLYKKSRFQQLRGSELAGLATTFVRYIEERQKPDPERLDGFHDSQLPALELQLFSPAPVYPALDEVLLANALQESLEALGPSDPFIEAVLKGRNPADVAREAIRGTRLGDPEARRAFGGEWPGWPRVQH
jgi:hypothetical protein